MINFFRKFHLWLSVPFGLIVTLICFSGAMLVFEIEITRQIQKDIYYVSSVEDNPIPMDQLMNTVKATLPDSVSITGVTVFKDQDRTYQVSLSKPMRASVFIDQYSGKITGKYERLGFFSTMFRLHRWLLDSANPNGDGVKVGKLLVGISTLIFVFVLVSGVVIWWPRARKGLRRSLSITFAKGWNGFWRSLHVAGGMYALVIVLAMALTGLTWSFEWYRNAFYSVFGVENTPRSGMQSNQVKGNGRDGRGENGRNKGPKVEMGHEGEDFVQSEFLYWQSIYDDLKSDNPESPQITISDGKASVTLSNIGNVRAADSYQFNPRDGSIIEKTAYSDSDKANKLRGWISSIHMGTLGGVLTKILWLLSALLGASLPLTGYYIWIKRIRRKEHNAVTTAR